MTLNVVNLTSSNYGVISGTKIDVGWNDTTVYTLPQGTWTVQLSPTFTDIRITGIGDAGTGDASWVPAGALVDRGRIGATAAVFTFSNLDNAKTYTLYGLSSSNVSGRISAWTVNGGGTVQEVPDEISGVPNKSESAIFSGIAPSSGVITLEVSKAGTSGGDSYVAAAAIEEETATSPSLTVTQSELTPGGTISGTYSNYTAAPTTLTVSDGTNTITIISPTIDDVNKTFSGTMPSLPTSGTANLVLFGNVTVELT